jgi:hypothetical protein
MTARKGASASRAQIQSRRADGDSVARLTSPRNLASAYGPTAKWAGKRRHFLQWPYNTPSHRCSAYTIAGERTT